MSPFTSCRYSVTFVAMILAMTSPCFAGFVDFTPHTWGGPKQSVTIDDLTVSALSGNLYAFRENPPFSNHIWASDDVGNSDILLHFDSPIHLLRMQTWAGGESTWTLHAYGAGGEVASDTESMLGSTIAQFSIETAQPFTQARLIEDPTVPFGYLYLTLFNYINYEAETSIPEPTAAVCSAVAGFTLLRLRPRTAAARSVSVSRDSVKLVS